MPSTERAVEQLRKMVELFADGKGIRTAVRLAYLRPVKNPSSAWSFQNRILVMMSGTWDARGYRQWQEVGRHVKKGAKAIYILGPRIRKVQDDEGDGGAGNRKEPRSVVIGFRVIPVFRYEDTDGKPLVTVKNQPKKLPPLTNVAKQWGVTIRYDGSLAGEYGSFSPKRNEIRLCSADHTVFFHELAHKAHSRMEKLKSGQDPEQEAIAELSACVLADLYGIDMTGETYEYIRHYSEGNTPEDVGKMCYRVLDKTEKVISSILEADSVAQSCDKTMSAEAAVPVAIPVMENA